MKKTDVNERFIRCVEALLNQKVISSKSELSQIFGIGSSKLSEILNRRMNVGVDVIAILCEKYEISSQWLLMGYGEMFEKSELHKVEQAQCLQYNQKMIDDLSASIKELSGTVKNLSETFGSLIARGK